MDGTPDEIVGDEDVRRVYLGESFASDLNLPLARIRVELGDGPRPALELRQRQSW